MIHNCICLLNGKMLNESCREQRSAWRKVSICQNLMTIKPIFWYLVLNAVLTIILTVHDIKYLFWTSYNAARVIAKNLRKIYIRPVLFSLHLLSISMRIMSKVLMFCFICLNGEGRKYLSNLFKMYITGRSFTNKNKL